MKTSIILSSFAALCLLVTFAESPTRRNSDSYNASSASHYTYVPANLVTAKPAITISAAKAKASKIESSATVAEDISYLKFDVADYSDAEKMAAEVSTENSFEYLKFDVNDYNADYEVNSFDAIDLPADELGYLKFDVNDYTTTDAKESIELPESDFDYLKFDVADYTTTDAAESIELPESNFNYLKFDVNNYTTTDAAESIELPESNYYYLKFDVNAFASQNTPGIDYYGELLSNQ